MIKHNKFITLLVFILTILTLATFGFSYDRESARGYADKFSNNTGNLNGLNPDTLRYYNYLTYNRYEYDCTNFSSQVLRAGGIRFRSGGFEFYPFPPGKRTVDSKGCLTQPVDLDAYLRGQYTTLTKYSEIDLNKIKVGDVVFLRTLWGTWDYHSMIVTQDLSKGEILLNAHSKDRKDYALTDMLNDPKIGPDKIYFTHINDSPIVRSIVITQKNETTNQDETVYKAIHNYETNKNEIKIDKGLKKGQAKVKIIFDTQIDRAKDFSVKFGFKRHNIPHLVPVTPDTNPWSSTNIPSNYFNFEYTGSYDTWSGSFEIKNPENYYLKIDAYGMDGSRIDHDEDLSQYTPNPDEQHKFIVPPVIQKETKHKSIPTHQDSYSEGSTVELSCKVANLRKLENVDISKGDFFYNSLPGATKYKLLTKAQYEAGEEGIYVEFKNDSGVELHRKPFVGEANGDYPLYEISADTLEQEVNADETVTIKFKILYVGLSREASGNKEIQKIIFHINGNNISLEDGVVLVAEKRETYDFRANLPAGASNATLSPDLTKISYVITTGQYPSYTYQIHVMNRDGSNKKSINTISYGFSPNFLLRWSPDSNKIAYDDAEFYANYTTYYITTFNWGNNTYTTGEYKTIRKISENEFNIFSLGLIWNSDSSKIAYSYINWKREDWEGKVGEDNKIPYTTKITQKAYIEIIDVETGVRDKRTASTSSGKDTFVTDISGEIGSVSSPFILSYYSWGGRRERIDSNVVGIIWGKDNNLYYVLNSTLEEGSEVFEFWSSWIFRSPPFFLPPRSGDKTIRSLSSGGIAVNKESCIKEIGGRVVANYPSSYNMPGYSYKKTEEYDGETDNWVITIEGALPLYVRNYDSISTVKIAKSGKVAYMLRNVEVYYSGGDPFRWDDVKSLYVDNKKIITVSSPWWIFLEWSPVEDILGYTTRDPAQFYLYDARTRANILVTNVIRDVNWNKDGDKVSGGRYEIINPKGIIEGEKPKLVELPPILFFSRYSSKEKEEIFSYPLSVISKRITAGISEPNEYEIVSSSNYGVKDITGTAKALRGIANWKLEYAYKDDASKNDEQLDWANHVIGSGNTEIFDGVLGSLDTSGLKDATYRLRLNVTDKTTPTAVTESTTTKVRVRNNLAIAEVTGQPTAEVVIPSSEPIPLTFTLNQDCWVNVKVKDSSENIVATISDNYVYPAGSNTVYWWGTSDDGTWVSEGNYKFEILPTDVTKISYIPFLAKARLLSVLGEIPGNKPSENKLDLVEVDSMGFSDLVKDFSLPSEEEQKKLGDKIIYPKVVKVQGYVYFYDNSKKQKKIIELESLHEDAISIASILPNGNVIIGKVDKKDNKIIQIIDFYTSNGEKLPHRIVYKFVNPELNYSNNSKYFTLDTTWSAVCDFEVYEIEKQKFKKLWSKPIDYWPMVGILDDGKVILNTQRVEKNVSTPTITIFNTDGSVYNEFIRNWTNPFYKVLPLDNRSFLLSRSLFRLYDIDKGIIFSADDRYSILVYTYSSFKLTTSDKRYIAVYDKEKDNIVVLDLIEKKEKWSYNINYLRKEYNTENTFKSYKGQFSFLDDKYLLYIFQKWEKEGEQILPRDTKLIIFNFEGEIMLEKTIKSIAQSVLEVAMTNNRKYLLIHTHPKGGQHIIKIFKIVGGELK